MTGTLWRSTAHETFAAAPFQGAVSADLVVIGGGYTGCAAALEAAEQGASVVLLEAEQIGHGGSGRNVGLVNAGLWLLPRDVEAVLGPADGGHLNKLLADAPSVVFDLIHAYQIRCEATRNGTLQCANDDKGLAYLQTRFAQLQGQGAPVRLLNAGETKVRTGASNYAGALFDARAGTIHPLDYVRGLARAAVSNGAQVHENSPVIRISHAGHWNVETAAGRVSAARMIVATNAYHQNITGVVLPDVAQVNYFQVATEPLSQSVLEELLPGGEGCWDTHTVMSSFRIDRTGRLIFGAIGRPEIGGKGIHHGWAARKVREVFPELGRVQFQSEVHGRISMPSDRVPKILTLGAGGCAVFGFAGRGIGPGTVFGQSVADALLNGDESKLPMPATKRLRERGAVLKSLFYEAGARAVHLFGARSK